MPNLVTSLAHTGRLAEAFAGRRHRGKLCSVNLWMALAVPNEVCRWHFSANHAERCPGSGVKQPCRRNPETAEVDPTETLVVSDFRSAKALFVPSLKRDIFPSVAWT